jgi:hypothetical protein
MVLFTVHSEAAFAHGTESIGCVVGGPCVETNAITPVYIMFMALGLFGALFFTHNAFSGRVEKQRIWTIFDIQG